MGSQDTGSEWDWGLEAFWIAGREGLYSVNKRLLNICYEPSPGPGWPLPPMGT